MAFCSCGKDSTTSEKAISFGEVKTKTVTDDALQFSGSEFVVNGIMSGTPAFSGITETVFNKKTVSWSGSAWEYSEKQYWYNGRSYRFRAVHPASLAGEYTDDLMTSATLPISISETIGDQEDILISDMATADGSAHPTVNLTFHHLLCKVNVIVKKAEGDEDQFSINSVTLVGMKGDWKYSLIGSGNGSSWGASWSSSSSSRQLKYVSAVTGAVSTSEVHLFGAEGLLLVPEDLSNISLVVDYRVGHVLTKPDPGDSSTWTYDYKDRKKTFSIPSTPLWQSGKEITYTLTMAEPYNIMFGTPTVREWGEVRNTGTVVIK